MIVETRKTAQGTEYWDNKEKKILFVPIGETPNFEVTEEYDSLIYKEDKSEKDTPPGETLQLEDMTVALLREYAEDKGIDIPKEVRKKEDIIKLLNDSK